MPLYQLLSCHFHELQPSACHFHELQPSACHFHELQPSDRYLVRGWGGGKEDHIRNHLTRFEPLARGVELFVESGWHMLPASGYRQFL